MEFTRVNSKVKSGKMKKELDDLCYAINALNSKIWKELYEEYGEEKVRQASKKTACGCAMCTKSLLEYENHRPQT